MPQEDTQTEEMLLLTCSPHINGYNLEQLAKLLEMMVVSIGENFYFIPRPVSMRLSTKSMAMANSLKSMENLNKCRKIRDERSQALATMLAMS